MQHRPVIVATCLVLAGAPAARAQIVPGTDFVVFAVNQSATTASGSSGHAALASLGPTDLVHFSPFVFLSAEKVSTNAALNVLMGDLDGDDDHFENFIGGFDAAEIPHVPVPPLVTRSIYDYVFSTTADFGGVTKGDVFRFVHGGLAGDSLAVVLSEAQIVSALGQPAGSTLDVDAFAQDDSGNLYLSFADDESVNSVVTGDGAVILLPIAALTYGADGTVLGVLPNSAVVILTEPDVDAMVQNAGLLFASTIDDLSCLSIDPNGGVFVGQDGMPHPNLDFSGENLGATILSTALGGSPAIGNFGFPLASPVMNPFTLGLGSITGGLSALVIREETGRALTTDVADGEVVFPGENFVQWQVVNAVPNSSILFFVGFSAGTPGNQPVSVPVFGKVFPGFFALPFNPNLVFNVPTDANGIATLTATLPHSVSPNVLIGQPYDQGIPGIGFPEQLGAPAAIWFP